MKCSLDNIPGIIKKTVFVKDIPYYIQEGWNFLTEEDRKKYELLIEKEKKND